MATVRHLVVGAKEWGVRMTDGCFVEGAEDAHVALRSTLLTSGAVLAAPPVPVVDGRLAEVAPLIGAALHRDGVALVRLVEPPGDEEYLAFGATLGEAVPERDPAVLPFTRHSVLLELVTTHARGAPPSLQPFSTDMLSLHSEGSGRPVAEQPRYIALLCSDPGADTAAAQTALVPMAAVAGRLSTADHALLRQVRYRNSVLGPRIARDDDGRTVFSFRDFLGDALHWTTDPLDGDGGPPAPDVGPADVAAALRRLLAAMYAPGQAMGVHWQHDMLVVLDNTVFFHGRTLGPAAVSRPHRHLRRLRLVRWFT